jgi:hypothetical protein
MPWSEFDGRATTMLWLLHEAGALTEDIPDRIEVTLVWEDDDAQA